MINKKLNKKKKATRKPVQSFTELRTKLAKKPKEFRTSRKLSQGDLQRMEGEGPGTPSASASQTFE